MKLLLLFYLTFSSPSMTSAQSSFSPFSFLGSLFNSANNWPNTKQNRPRKLQQPKLQLHLRLQSSSDSQFSGSQTHPQLLRYPHRHHVAPQTFSTTTAPKSSKIIRVIPQPPPVVSLTFTKPSFSKPQNSNAIIDNAKKVKSLSISNTVNQLAEDTHSGVTPQSSFSSFSPSHESLVSGPNPGDFPIISLIDEPGLNYYDQVFKKTKPVNDNSNPYYAAEEFNYNQDPIHIDHSEPIFDFNNEVDDKFVNSFVEDANTFETEAPTLSTTFQPNTVPFTDVTETVTAATEEPTLGPFEYETLINTNEIVRKREPKSLEFVDPIEYNEIDYKVESENNATEIFVPSIDSLVDCGVDSEKGFCTMTSSYPTERIEALYKHCSDIIEAFKAVIPEDFDALGDNSINVISSEKDLTRPWSWKVYAYKKHQICESELSFTRPSYALDTEGNWSVILQTEQILQRVSLDTCTRPNYPCPGLQGCGKRSSCVQRFSHQLLLSLPSISSSTSLCPSIRAFKFPSGCVCHAETMNDEDLISDSHSNL